MLPMKSVRLQLGTLLAADTTTLAPVAANKIALISAPFTPNEGLVIGDLTLATGNGLSALAGVAGAQEVALDAVSGLQVITLIPPATGWRWVTSGVFAAPVTIYGYALIDNGAANLLAVEAIAVPVVVDAAGFAIDIDPVTMQLVASPIF